MEKIAVIGLGYVGLPMHPYLPETEKERVVSELEDCIQ